MSIPICGDEAHLGRSCSVSQLLYMAKAKLREATFSRRSVWNRNHDMLDNSTKTYLCRIVATADQIQVKQKEREPVDTFMAAYTRF